MAIEGTAWFCKYCNTPHRKKEWAEVCEASHRYPVGLIRGRDWDDGDEYPHIVSIRMDNGAEIEYYRNDEA